MDDGSHLKRRSVLKSTGLMATATLTSSGIVTAQSGPPWRGSKFEVGAVRNNATPRPEHLDQGVFLGGHGLGPERRAEGVHDGSYARALAVSVDDTTVVFSMLDAVGLGNRIIETIRSKAATESPLDPAHILVGASHSHAAPDFQGLWGGVSRDYEEFVIEQMVDAIVRAVDSKREATGRIGQVDAPELSSNRRDWGENTDIVNAIQFEGRRGEAIGTLVTYAAHQTEIGSSNTLVATDYVGPLEREIEDEYGGVGIFFPEAIGDASSSGSSGETDYDEAVDYGKQLFSHVEDALRGADRIDPALSIRSANVHLPMDNCVFRVAFESGLLRRYYDGESLTGSVVGGSAGLVGGVLPEGESVLNDVEDVLPDVGVIGINSPVSRVSLGGTNPSVEMVTIPGEAVTRLAFDLFDIMNADYNVLLGLTQNTLGYLVKRDEFAELEDRNYEETVSFGPDTAPLYRSTVEGLFDASPEDIQRSDFENRTCPALQLVLEEQFDELSEGEWFESVDSVDELSLESIPEEQ